MDPSELTFRPGRPIGFGWTNHSYGGKTIVTVDDRTIAATHISQVWTDLIEWVKTGAINSSFYFEPDKSWWFHTT